MKIKILVATAITGLFAATLSYADYNNSAVTGAGAAMSGNVATDNTASNTNSQSSTNNTMKAQPAPSPTDSQGTSDVPNGNDDY